MRKQAQMGGGRKLAALLALVAASVLSGGVNAATVDLASVEGDRLEVSSLAAGTDYTNSSDAAKTLALNLSGGASYAGTISGKIKLEIVMGTKTTTLTLTGNNTFTEGIDVKTGTLRVTRPEALGSGTITLVNGYKGVLKFGASMSVANPIVLNNYSSADYAATLEVEGNCEVLLSGCVTSRQSWAKANTGATLTFAGGVDVATSELFCDAYGVISFSQTPIAIPSGKVLKVVGNRTFSFDRRVDMDVSDNDVSQISFVNRGCLRLGVDGAFSNKPNLYLPHDSRGLERNGGGVDLHGHSQNFGKLSFEHGAAQNSFLVCNTASSQATFSFEQTSDETSAFVETAGPLDFVKKGTAAFTVTNSTFAVSGRVDVVAGTLRFTGIDGTRLAESVSVRAGAILDLGGHMVTCGTFLNMGGVVTNGTLAAATNSVVAPAGSTVSLSDKDLAIYYPLDRADRLCVDQSFHGNADLLSRGSPECVEDAKFGKALSLDGSSALTNSVFPATLPTGASAWSTCIFLKLRNFVSNNKYHPIGWGDCSMSKANFLQLIGNNKFNHIIWSDTALLGTLPSGNFADGWHSLVVTYSPADNVRSMYFDGTCVSSGAINRDGTSRTPAVAAKDFTLGGKHNSERDWNGWLDEAAVFRRTLTAEEVAEYHAHGASGLVGKPLGSTEYDGLVAEEGATLRIAQAVTTPGLFGPGTVETWGMKVTERVSGCPSVVGDLTLAADIEIDLASLPDAAPLPLLHVTGGDLVCEGAVRLVVNGTCNPDLYRVFVRDGTLYGQCRCGTLVIFK